MREIWNQPRQIYLRRWPQAVYDRTWDARFRWTEGDQEHRQERRVIISQRHSDIPMNSLHYQMWDELRTDLAQGVRSGDSVWTGLARDSQDQWCQDHAFCVIMQGREPKTMISLHYNRWLVPGHVRRQPNQAYEDWTFDSRRLKDLCK